MNCRSTIMKMVYKLASTRNIRVARSAHLIGTRIPCVVCSARTPVADADLSKKWNSHRIQNKKQQKTMQCLGCPKVDVQLGEMMKVSEVCKHPKIILRTIL